MLKRQIILLACVLCAAACFICSAAADWTDLPYWVGVDKTAQRVTIYSTSDNRALYCWKCSTAVVFGATPRGTFYMPQKKSASERTDDLMYAVDGMYFTWASRINGPILFHSIIFNGPDWSDLDVSTVDLLGKPASHGCIRLGVDEARWIAQNVMPGSKVIIYDNSKDKLILNALGQAPETELRGLSNPASGIHILADGLPISSPLVIQKGAAMQLQYALEPVDAKTQVTWTSSSAAVAKVTRNGLVTGMKSGVVTISAVAGNGVRRSITL